jgi:hypothetical protein
VKPNATRLERLEEEGFTLKMAKLWQVIGFFSGDFSHLNCLRIGF